MKDFGYIDCVVNLTSQSLSTNYGIGHLVKTNIDLNTIFQLQLVNSIQSLNFSTFSKLKDDNISLFLNNGSSISIHFFEIRFNNFEQDFRTLNEKLDLYFQNKEENIFNSLVLLGSGTIFSKDLDSIKHLLNDRLNCDVKTVEFKYINNLPGILFYIPINNNFKHDMVINTNGVNEMTENMENHIKPKQKRGRVELEMNTYSKIMNRIHLSMKSNNQSIKVKDLMEKFEQEVEFELKKINPSDDFIIRNLDIFRSKGESGAKRAQVLMRITNEPTRVHFFQNKRRDEFNLFTYCDGYENIKFSDRNLMIYDSNNQYIKTQIVYPDENKK